MSGMRGAGIARRLRLPTENALMGVSGQGWQVNTVVRQSRIPGAGNGRFTTHGVKANTPLSVKPMVEMARVTALGELPPDRVLTFSGVDDLEKYIVLSEQEGGVARDKVLDLYSNFVWSLDGRRACLNVSTWSVNHANEISDGLNVDFREKELPDGGVAMVGTSLVDLGPDAELRNDYRLFNLPEFYLRYCDDHGFKDVRSIVMEAIGQE